MVRASELAVFARAEGADQVDLERGARRGHLRIWAPPLENGTLSLTEDGVGVELTHFLSASSI